MLWILAGILLVVVGVLAGLYRISARYALDPASARIHELPHYIGEFLEVWVPGSLMIFEHNGSDKVFRFLKERNAGADTPALSFAVIDEGTMSASFRAYQVALQSKEHAYEVVTSESGRVIEVGPLSSHEEINRVLTLARRVFKVNDAALFSIVHQGKMGPMEDW